jgi:hypothetical protein
MIRCRKINWMQEDQLDAGRSIGCRKINWMQEDQLDESEALIVVEDRM